MNTAHFVSIIITVYRTPGTLQILYHRIRQVLEKCHVTFEVIFVDDASPDHSARIIESISREDNRVILIPLMKNVGQHQAVLTGLSHCRGDWAIIMDADLQDSPEDIPALLSKGQEGFDAVFAARRGIHESFFRLFTSRLFKYILHLLCGMNPDTGTFVAINRSMIDLLLRMHGPYPYIPGMIHCTGMKIGSIPVIRAKRPAGESSYNIWRRIKLAWRAISWVLAWKWKTLFKYAPPVQKTDI
jgi:glycosyltransferase involved in cell wall biosynthesis